MQRFILASQSPRRKQLLEWAEMQFDIIVHSTDESFPEGFSPAEAAEHIAKEKAKVVADLNPGKTVVAADTIVVLNNEIIGKPVDRQDAVNILSGLSGKKHEVITAVCIMKGSKQILFHDKTGVEFYVLTQEQIEFYVDKYQPYDKAGAYAIQEWIGVTGIKKIDGDFYNVMGLPVSRVVRELQHFTAE